MKPSTDKDARKKPPTVKKVVLAVECAIAVLAAVGVHSALTRASIQADAGATVGDAGSMTREQMQEQLDRVVRENMMYVSVSAEPTLDGDDLGINAVNDESNKFSQMYSVIQDGKLLAESGSVPPGSKLDSIACPGVHTGEATIRIQAVEQDTGGVHGSPTEVAVEICKA